MDSNILKTEYVVLNSKSKTKDEALQELSFLGLKFNIVNDSEKLLEGYKKRESEFSTGLEDGFAIPHAKIKEIKKASIFVIKYSNAIDWQTLDNSKVSIVISLMIPDKSNEQHLGLLSQVSQKLMSSEIRDKIKKSKDPQDIIDLLMNKSIQKNNVDDNLTKKGYVIAITGCPAGVAHTYMSASKIEEYAISMGWAVKVEKQGANGIEDKLTKEDIDNANILLVAADINPAEMDRFENIPLLKTSVVEPIHNMEKLWNKLMLSIREIKGQTFKNKNISSVKEKFNFKTSFRRQSKGLKNAILTGISYVVPVIVAGTTISALATIITQIAGADIITQNANWLNTLSSVAGGALSILLAPILSGYIAFAMADKPGLFPGFLGGLACNGVTYSKMVDGTETTIVAGLGFLGGLISGIIVGYIMIGAKKWIKSKRFQGVLTWFVYPVLGSLIIMSIILFAIGNPLALGISAIFDGLTKLQQTKASFAVGLIIGMLCVIDLGGPFNKVAWAFSFASFSQAFEGDHLVNAALLAPYTAFWAAGIGTGWTTSMVSIIGKKLCNSEEKEAGKIAWIMSSLGITEGSIPMMLSDPFRVIPSFMVGGAVSGSLSYALNIGSTITGGGFITVAGIQSTNGSMAIWVAILVFLIIALIGSIISILLILTLKWLHTKPEKEAKVGRITAQIFTFGLINIKYKKDKQKEKLEIKK